MPLQTTNPATEEVVKTFASLTRDELSSRIERSARAFESHRNTSFADRATKMYRAAEILEERKLEFGRMMTIEMGKPIKAAVAEVEKCAWVCRYYAENAERFLADEPAASGASKSWVAFQPLGSVLAVMPWNFPFWQVFRFAAPALMEGNTGLLKHSSNVPQCALAIEEVFVQAGFAPDVFQTLMIGSDLVASVIENPHVKAVTLTGSTPAGISVASTAGRVLKKSVLELGGSDPFIVMPSAAFDDAVTTAVKARVINNGQSCIAAKRFIVHEQVADAFVKKFVEIMRALKLGDPMDESTDIGPLATSAIRDELHEQVQASVAAGARVALGGKKIAGKGWFYEPTVLTDIPKNSPAYSDELFGPVAMIFRVRSIEESVHLANDTVFGLGSSAWTNVASEQEYFIKNLEAGSVFINGMVASDPRLPFGGVKTSGYGRELGSYGIREFVNVKTVWVK